MLSCESEFVMYRNLLRSICFVIVLLVMFFDSVSTPAQESERAIVGAIRWDGWFANNTWAKNLEPTEYHYRLPFYTTWQDAKPIINADKQEVMDKEIDYASGAGLDYWAFVYYYPTSWPGADSYNYGLRLYLSSEKKSRINFCLNLQGWHLGPKDKWPETVQYFVGLFKKSTYQTVLGGRPLIYMLYIPKMIELFGGEIQAKKALDILRNKTIEAGLKNPYMVAQVFDVNEGCYYVANLGFDAVGAYTIFGYGAKQVYPLKKLQSSNDANQINCEFPYQSLRQVNRDFWNACREKGQKVVPIVNSGWDWRPRLADKEAASRYSKYGQHWFAQPRPTELAEHLKNGIEWISKYREAAMANALLIYAWNENDEGGWLVPTIDEGAARLNAIRGVLRKD
ncbi:MAG: hypothetical protein DRP62_05050 [Planctomycetota bacterium]|nr:MAG: hypothetical protein DRP62_05050 [Planctomycetota bacterium]